MKIPPLQPENYQEIYQAFGDLRPNPRTQKLGFAVMHLAYKSQVHYEHQADQIIKHHLQAGGSVIIAPNHQSNADTPTVGGLAYEDCFSGLAGATTAPGKADMFTWPVLGKYVFPHLLIHPTFRGKDFTADEPGQLLRKQVTDRLLQFNVDFINRGGNVALFPEGTRNKDNPRHIQKIRGGIAHIALGVEDPVRTLIVPMGFAYRSPRLHLRPLVVVAEPFSPAGLMHDDILHKTGTAMQSAVDQAFDLTT